ncbi:AMP-binding protein [Nocardia sp. CA-129566]|uniref:AMP-binding protein n=1 Tax=Nocardia sp. CA-129566 TaxID=3239976 RepID=UPI003D959194
MPERPATDFLDRLAEIADRHPDRPAFVVAQSDHREQTLTFAGLRADWLELASRLTAYGLGSGDVLVITLRNHIHYLSLIFGAWQAGIAAPPISPVLAPADRDALLQVVQAELGRPVVVDTVPHESYDSVVVHADQPISFVPAENPTATTDSDRPDHELGYL